jgi:hypothetical protein
MKIPSVSKYAKSILPASHQLPIKRGFLKHHTFTTTEEKIIHILMWGYSSGGRGKNIQYALGHLHQIASLVNQNTPWPQYYRGLKAIPGVGISTITKLAYFFHKSFHGHPALILDSQIADILISGTWSGLSGPANTNEKSMEKHYLRYLAETQIIANSLGFSSDKIELFLFLLGKNFS